VQIHSHYFVFGSFAVGEKINDGSVMIDIMIIGLELIVDGDKRSIRVFEFLGNDGIAAG
jgi:hypothetical protein